MTRKLYVLWLSGALLVTSATFAQQTTERYIPIGKSPGVTQSIIGEITAVDYDDHSMAVRGDDGEMTVRMIDSTRYYLDRTKNKESNRSASIEDCRVGRRVEVKYGDDSTADWVKIEAD